MDNIVAYRIAQSPEWTPSRCPPMQASGYEYILAGNGIFVRAEDSRMKAMVLYRPAEVHGLSRLPQTARLKDSLIPCTWLHSIVASMRRHLPNECMYQIVRSGNDWRCVMPKQTVSATAVEFDDNPLSVVDIHSHNTMRPFWSTTDDADEQGLRFYVVIGNLDQAMPTARARAGVYGYHLDIPLDAIFDDYGLGWPVRDLFGEYGGNEDDEPIR